MVARCIDHIMVGIEKINELNGLFSVHPALVVRKRGGVPLEMDMHALRKLPLASASVLL